MTRQALLCAWAEGASLLTLAELLGEDPRDLEAAVRLELQPALNEFASSRRVPPSAATSRPLPDAATVAAPAPPPAGAAELQIPSASRMLDLTGYPAPLQDPARKLERAVWDALDVPRTWDEIDDEIAPANMYQLERAIQWLRANHLIELSDESPRKYQRAKEMPSC
jgi:hypothetical protein